MMAWVTVVETAAFAAAAKAVGMSDRDVSEAVTMIAADPTCGDVMEGTGGLRKVRFAIGGRGKSGGVRICYAFRNAAQPIYLVTVFAKNRKSNLDAGERRRVKKVVDGLFER